MDDNEYNRIFKKAKLFAERRGFGDESDDFAQEFAIKSYELGFEGNLEWLFIDYSRQQRADKRVLGSPSGYLSKSLTKSLEQPLSTSDDTSATLGDLIGSFRDGVEYGRELELNLSVLSEREQMIFLMRLESGMNQKEIGDELGFTESRASQLLMDITEKLQKLNEGVDFLCQIMRRQGSDAARLFAINNFIKKMKG
jgi:RNA polymerase sigma factor (sigma-70 family)